MYPLIKDHGEVDLKITENGTATCTAVDDICVIARLRFAKVYYVDKSSMQINGMEHAGPSVILGEETDTFKEQLWYLTQ